MAENLIDCYIFDMKIKRKPIVLVRKVQGFFEYYIQQGNRKINFFLDSETHADLKDAQAFAERVPQKQGQERAVIPLQLSEHDQKKRAGATPGSVPVESK